MSLPRFFRRRYWDEERRRELDAYLEAETEENIARGMSREEARYAAHRKLGNTTLIREEIYHMNSLGWLETLWQDVRYGLRQLKRSPGFTAVAVITLGLGIGANTAIFSVVNAVLLRPLPFKNPDQLLNVWETNLKRTTSQMPASYSDFLDWRAQNHVLENIAVHNYSTFTLLGLKEPIHVEGRVCSADFFSVLGVKPALGRGFLPEEDQPGHHVVVLSHDLWQRVFSSDPRVLGQSIQLDRMSFTVVGVMPAGFQFPIQAQPVEVWAAMGLAPEIPNERGNHSFEVIARLRSQVTLQQAKAEMGIIAARLAKQYPNSNKDLGVKLIPEHEELVGKLRTAMLILLVAVVLVLLIACVNVANLLLARGANREREIAVRAALGAGRLRTVRQLLTENLLIAALGGALGALLASAITRLLVRLGPQDIPRLSEIGFDGRVLVFSLALILATGLIFGLVPALRTARADLIQSLKTCGAVSQGGPRRRNLRAALVVGEVALTLLLLAGAGLMVNSLFRLTRVNPGFNPSGVLTFAVDLPNTSSNGAQLAARFSEILERIKQSSGVRSAAADTSLPLSGIDTMYSGFQVEGLPTWNSTWAATSIVTPNFFRTLNIPLVSGRDFTVHDDLAAPPVVIVSQSFAREYFPSQDVVGKRIATAINVGDTRPLRHIIGVVGDVRRDSLPDKPTAALYLPESQIPMPTMRFVVRSTAPLQASVAEMRAAVRSVDSNLAVYDVKTLDQYLGLAVSQSRFNTVVLGLFAVVALVLSAVGLYGVISYTVSRRTHEFGLRLALGATGSDVIRGVLRQGLTLALIGIGVGLVGAIPLTRFLASQLYGVKPADPLTLIAVSAVFAGIAFVASYIPARRATKVDPMVALRYE